jgi:hypothetical protein
MPSATQTHGTDPVRLLALPSFCPASSIMPALRSGFRGKKMLDGNKRVTFDPFISVEHGSSV